MSADPTITDPFPPEQAPPAERGSVQEFRLQMANISRQSSVYFAGTIFTAVAGYLFKVYLARMLGAEALGIYALGMTISGFFGVFNALGLPQSAVRFVAKYTASRQWAHLSGFVVRSTAIVLVLNCALAVLMVAAGPRIASRFYHVPALTRYIPLFAVIMLLGALTFFLGQVLTGYKDVARRTIITSFIANPLNMAIAILMISLGYGLWGYIFAQVLSAALVLVMLAVVIWRMTPVPARLPFRRTAALEPEVISFSAAAFGIGFLEFLMGQADKVLVGFYLDARSVGVYAVATVIVAFIPVLLQSVNQIFSPVISDLHSRSQHELLGRMFQTLTKWIFACTVPLAVVVIVLARHMMLVFGPDFERGWSVLVIGTLGQLVNCAVGSVGYLLLMSGNERRLIKVQAAGGIFMLAANLILIPRWGITGAAAAAAITVAFTNFWYARQVRAALGLTPYNRTYWRLLPPILGSVAAAYAFRPISSAVHPVWFGLIISVIGVYMVFVALVLLIGLKDEDRVLAHDVWMHMRRRSGGNSVPAKAVVQMGVHARDNTINEVQRRNVPVFIVGPSRSGTTLLARMLDEHSSLAIFPETWCYVVLDRLGCFEEFSNRWQYILFLNQIWDSLREYRDPAARVLAEEAAKRPSYAGPVRPILESFGRAYAEARGATRWGEKTPGHVLWLSQIHHLFPEAKILVCVRDPRDIVSSYDERWGGNKADTAYLMRASAQVRHYLRHLLQDSEYPPDQVCHIRYEELATHPQAILEKICGFLHLDFEPRMLEFYRSHLNVERDWPGGAYHRLLSKPATTERIGRYRSGFSGSQIALIERCLGEEMSQLGYPLHSLGPVQFSLEESAALSEGLRFYDQMRSGALRVRQRRRGKLKLLAYRSLGGPLASLPGARVAVTSKDWQARTRLHTESKEI